jgi:hypothetical protein
MIVRLGYLSNVKTEIVKSTFLTARLRLDSRFGVANRRGAKGRSEDSYEPTVATNSSSAIADDI